MSLMELLWGNRNCLAGCWFVLYEEDVIRKNRKKSKTPFATGKVGFWGRRVVLINDTCLSENPNVTVYPRSASNKRKDHSAHAAEHKTDHINCKVDTNGTVVFGVPCVVDTDKLDPKEDPKCWSCEEPTDSDLLESLNRVFKFGHGGTSDVL